MMKRPRLKPRIRMRSSQPKYQTNTSALAETDRYGVKRSTYGVMTGRWGRMTGRCGQHSARCGPRGSKSGAKVGR